MNYSSDGLAYLPSAASFARKRTGFGDESRVEDVLWSFRGWHLSDKGAGEKENYAMLLENEVAHEITAWEMRWSTEEERKRKQQLLKWSASKRPRLKQKVKDMVDRNIAHEEALRLGWSTCAHARDGRKVEVQFEGIDRVWTNETERRKERRVAVEVCESFQ